MTAKDRLYDQQPFDMAVPAERRAEQQREQHAHEVARRADGDTRGALVDGQVLAGKLADRAQHDRLGDRDHELAGHRPRKRVAAESDQPPERDHRTAAREHQAKPAIEQDPGGNREHDVQQRKDLRQPADRAHRDAVVSRRLGGDRRVGEPQKLGGGADEPVGDDHSPAGRSPHLLVSARGIVSLVAACGLRLPCS